MKITITPGVLVLFLLSAINVDAVPTHPRQQLAQRDTLRLVDEGLYTRGTPTAISRNLELEPRDPRVDAQTHVNNALQKVAAAEGEIQKCSDEWEAAFHAGNLVAMTNIHTQMIAAINALQGAQQELNLAHAVLRNLGWGT